MYLWNMVSNAEPSDYAWVITRDHLAEGDEPSAVGTSGPAIAPGELLEALERGQGRTFRLYDDDGLLCYTGRGLWLGEPDEPSESAAYGPLGDFGTAYAGCTMVRWHGHPEWDCC